MESETSEWDCLGTVVHPEQHEVFWHSAAEIAKVTGRWYTLLITKSGGCVIVPSPQAIPLSAHLGEPFYILAMFDGQGKLVKGAAEKRFIPVVQKQQGV